MLLQRIAQPNTQHLVRVFERKLLIVDMTQTPWTLDQFVAQFALARDLDEQIGVLKRAISSFGYDTYVFGLIPNTQPNEARDFIMITNYDPDWMQEYADRNFTPHDNVITHGLLRDEPILWSRYHTPEERELMTPEEALVIERSTAWGYHVGVTIPLWIPHSLVRYGMSFSTRWLMDFDAHDAMFEKHRHALVSMAKLFFLGADLSGKVFDHYGLTRAEQQIIALLSNGRKIKEITHLLNQEQARLHNGGDFSPITESALHQRVTRIWKKVGVKNTSHLLATMSELGIMPDSEFH